MYFMNRYVAAGSCWICLVSSSTAQPKELQLLQEAVHKAIDEVQPSIASILVSRSDRYREFDALPSGPEGKLGGFDPPPAAAVADPARRALIHRLNLADPEPIPESYGSGVVLDASGLILTHLHVVQNATKVYVRLPGKEGSYADIFAADGRSDLAVLKLINPPADLKPIRIGNGDRVRKGDFVIGVSSPFVSGSRCSPIAAHGIIGNLRRKAPSAGTESDRTATIHHYGTLLQTDLPVVSIPETDARRVNLGCSGGAVVNLAGEVIALTSSTAAIGGGDTPGGYAVPLTADIKRIIEVLLRGEEVEYGFLGVGVKVDRIEGALIDSINEGSPAKRGGLREGETIAAIGDVPIKNNDDLFLHVGAALAGSEVTLTVKNLFGQLRKVTVRLAKFNYPGPVIASRRPAAVFGLRVDFASVVQADWPLPEGAFIRDVERGSEAERKYKELFERARWIVTSVNGKPVASPADFYRLAAAVKGPLDLKLVEVVRSPELSTRTITLP
jgi:serine protease Do